MSPLSSAITHTGQASGAAHNPTTGRFQQIRNCCPSLCHLIQKIAHIIYDWILRAGRCFGLIRPAVALPAYVYNVSMLTNVKEIARVVGNEILAMRNAGLVMEEVTLPNGKKVCQTNADVAASKYIIQELSKKYPDYGILSQDQMEKDPLWHTKHAVWIVNPIDGTKEYEKGKKDFHIQIGLLYGQEPVFGLSYFPVSETYVYASIENGTWIENEGKVPIKIKANPSSEKVLLKSSTNEIVQAHLSQVGWVPTAVNDEASSSTSRLMKLISGVASLYISLGASPEGKEKKGGVWNYGANVVIAKEAGLILRTLKGEPLNLREPNALLVDGVYITNDPATSEAVMKAGWILN